MNAFGYKAKFTPCKHRLRVFTGEYLQTGSMPSVLQPFIDTRKSKKKQHAFLTSLRAHHTTKSSFFRLVGEKVYSQGISAISMCSSQTCLALVPQSDVLPRRSLDVK